MALLASGLGTDRLKPIFEKLGGQVPYDTIRLVARHLAAVGVPDGLGLAGGPSRAGVKSGVAAR